MEKLHNGYTLQIPQGCFPLSTDSIALAGFTKLPKNARVLDLGAGCATLGLLLCANDENCRITGIELDEAAHSAAMENIAANHLEGRLESICADIGAIPDILQPGSYSCCVSNPPYFAGGPLSKATPNARREDQLSLQTLFRSASWALKFGGDFFLVHRPERLGELIVQAGVHNLEAKRLCLLRHRPQEAVSLVLVQFRKGAKPGLKWEENTLFDTDGHPTAYYRTLYHLKEA